MVVLQMHLRPPAGIYAHNGGPKSAPSLASRSAGHVRRRENKCRPVFAERPASRLNYLLGWPFLVAFWLLLVAFGWPSRAEPAKVTYLLRSSGQIHPAASLFHSTRLGYLCSAAKSIFSRQISGNMRHRRHLAPLGAPRWTRSHFNRCRPVCLVASLAAAVGLMIAQWARRPAALHVPVCRAPLAAPSAAA